MVMKPQARPKRSFPVSHTLVGLAGWALYLFEPYRPLLILAITLSILMIPRFIRGSQREADKRIRQELSQKIEPSERVAGYMINGEILHVETTDHPIRMLGWYVGVALLTAGAGLLLFKMPYQKVPTWFFSAVLIVWAATILVVICKAVLWRHDKFCISNERVFVVRGYFRVRCEFMPLNKLAAGKIRTPWHSTILSWLRLIEVPYGTVRPDGAGEEDELKKAHFVPRVNQISSLLSTGR
jgi:hypothetical protein